MQNLIAVLDHHYKEVVYGYTRCGKTTDELGGVSIIPRGFYRDSPMPAALLPAHGQSPVDTGRHIRHAVSLCDRSTPCLPAGYAAQSALLRISQLPEARADPATIISDS